jgi:acyl carrier protein
MRIQETDFMPGTSESSILARVRRFVDENPLYRDRGFVPTEDDNFLEKAMVDSKYVGETITFIEEEFGVAVSSPEITEANLGTLRAVARFVSNKQPYAVG